MNIWSIVGSIIFLITLPGTIELLLLTTGAILNNLKKPFNNTLIIPKKLVVIIPAYNEEKTILKTIESLKACSENFDIMVVADNCTDSTVQIAKSANVLILERNDLVNRGKNHALLFAFEYLLKKSYDLFTVVDADTIVEPNFINVIFKKFSNNIDALQVCYEVSNSTTQNKKRLINIGFIAFNFIRPKGREFFGFSTGIFGNGFTLSRKILQEVPYQINSIVEDLAYHLKLVEQGYQVYYTDETKVLSEIPENNTGSQIQRSRWEGGRLSLLLEQAPIILKKILSGKLKLVEPLLDLLLLPLSYHLFLLLVLLCIPFRITQIYALIGITVVLLHVSSAIILKGSWKKDFLALLSAPYYLLWKLTIIKSIVHNIKAKNNWIRTPRNKK